MNNIFTQAKKAKIKQNYNCRFKTCDGSGTIFVEKKGIETLFKCRCSDKLTFMPEYNNFIDLPDGYKLTEYQKDIIQYYKNRDKNRDYWMDKYD